MNVVIQWGGSEISISKKTVAEIKDLKKDGFLVWKLGRKL